MKQEKHFKIYLWLLYSLIAVFFWVRGYGYFTSFLSTIPEGALSPLYLLTENRMRIALMYIIFGCFNMLIVLLDWMKETGKTDIPINVITFDNANWKDIPIGLGLLGLFLVFSYTMGISMVGMPGAVSGAMTLSDTSKSLYTASVAVIENPLIASIIPATMLMWLLYFFRKEKMYFIYAIPCALVGGLIGVWFHTVMYPSSMAYAQIATFIFFSIGSYVTLIKRSILPFDIAHFGYNFSIIFFTTLPYAVALI